MFGSKIVQAMLGAAAALLMVPAAALLDDSASAREPARKAGFVASAHLPTLAGDVPALTVAAHAEQEAVRLLELVLEQQRLEEQARELDRLRREAELLSAGRTGVNWDGIAQCETGGQWDHQTAFDGGLGILHVAWVNAMHGTAEWGRDPDLPDLGYPEWGSQATREQQIVVAERIYDEFGLSGWGCKAYG